jgi:hypothetical protein
MGDEMEMPAVIDPADKATWTCSVKMPVPASDATPSAIFVSRSCLKAALAMICA